MFGANLSIIVILEAIYLVQNANQASILYSSLNFTYFFRRITLTVVSVLIWLQLQLLHDNFPSRKGRDHCQQAMGKHNDHSSVTKPGSFSYVVHCLQLKIPTVF